MNILISMRPRQWIKNLVVFAALIFSRNLFMAEPFIKTFLGFILLCLLSGTVYLFNDIADREKDLAHPLKSKRPIASGRLSIKSTAISGGLISIIALFLGFLLEPKFFLIALVYFGLMIGYSFWLKRLVIIDVLVIAFGFLLRAVAGAVIIRVEISVWLFICAFLLALFLVLGKRRHELVLIGVEGREVLSHYSQGILDQLISVTTAAVLVAYILYTVAEATIAKFQTKWLVLTVPFVLYGIFRYLWLVYQQRLGGAPEKTLLADKPLLVDIVLWIISVVVIICGKY